MNIQNKILVALIALFCLSLSVPAQTILQDKSLNLRIRQKVAQMNDYVAFMASKRKTLSNRKYYMKKALNLFIGRGYAYEENGVRKEGVMMEVTSVNRNTTSHKLLRVYFNNLINLGYSDVEIQSTKIPDIKISKLKQIGDKTYQCTCEYDQMFVAYQDRIVVYKDKTTKRIECIVEEEKVEGGTEYVIMLGDVTALETKRI